MPDDIDISILLPVYNGDKYLAEALDSILAQTFDRFEVIAVNDGSTDMTKAVLEKYAGIDHRIKPFHIARQGIVKALNFGISKTNARFIARMDADDIMYPERLKYQYEFFQNNKHIDVVGTLIEKFSSRGIMSGYMHYTDWLNSLCNHTSICRDIFVESPLAHPCVMIRKDALVTVGGYKDFGWAEDYDLWLRLFVAGKRFGKVKKTLLRWRDESNRLSRQDSRYSLLNFYRCKTYYIATYSLKDREQVIIWGAKRRSRQFANLLTHYGISIIAYVDIDPRKIGNRIKDTPVIPPEQLNEYRQYPILSYVSTLGARDSIRAYLIEHGYIENRDFYMMA